MDEYAYLALAFSLIAYHCTSAGQLIRLPHAQPIIRDYNCIFLKFRLISQKILSHISIESFHFILWDQQQSLGLIPTRSFYANPTTETTGYISLPLSLFLLSIYSFVVSMTTKAAPRPCRATYVALKKIVLVERKTMTSVCDVSRWPPAVWLPRLFGLDPSSTIVVDRRDKWICMIEQWRGTLLFRLVLTFCPEGWKRCISRALMTLCPEGWKMCVQCGHLNRLGLRACLKWSTR